MMSNDDPPTLRAIVLANDEAGQPRKINLRIFCARPTSLSAVQKSARNGGTPSSGFLLFRDAP